MPPALPRCLLAFLAAGVALALVACAGDGEPPPFALTVVIENPATPVPTAAALGTQATAPPSTQPTPRPSATPSSPAPAATPSGALQLKPVQLVQGGVAIVYLNEPASSATVRFQDRQYPMLHDGARWWTIIGVGAFTPPGLLPISVTYTPSGRDTSSSIVHSINVAKRDFPIEHITLDSQTAALLAPDIVQAELAQRAAVFSGFTAQRLWSGPFRAPSAGEISSIYGEGRSYNNGPVTDYHRGTDFAGQIGAPVLAAAAGRVVFVGALQVRGNAIIIDHGAGVFSAYHHLSATNVTQGQLVAAGDRIGSVGSTGLVTGPHLHWEVIVRGIEVDGERWLTNAEIGP